MRDFLISLTVLGAGGYGLWLMLRNGGTKKVKDEVDPEAPRFIERRRAASEAAAAADVVLSEAEVAEVAELHEYFQEIGTGEQFLVLAFDADPLSAPIPDDRAQAEPALFEDVWKERLSLFTWSPPTSGSASRLGAGPRARVVRTGEFHARLEALGHRADGR